MIALTRSLAVEYAHQNVRVNAVAPGPIDTEAFRASGGDPTKRAQSIPTRSMVEPQEVAAACLFLARPLCSLTGHTLLLDGGKISNAVFARVVLNGKTLHQNLTVKNPTTGTKRKELPKGPLRLQGDHGAVAFRNIKAFVLD